MCGPPVAMLGPSPVERLSAVAWATGNEVVTQSQREGGAKKVVAKVGEPPSASAHIFDR